MSKNIKLNNILVKTRPHMSPLQGGENSYRAEWDKTSKARNFCLPYKK